MAHFRQPARRPCLSGVFLAALTVAGCGQRDPAALGQVALAANLFRNGQVTIVAAGELAAPAERAAVRWRREGLEVAVVETPEGLPPGGARVVVGTPAVPLVAELLKTIGVDRESRDWEVLGRQVNPVEAVVVATIEDPGRPGLPLTLLAAGAPRLVAGMLDNLRPGARPALWLWKGLTPLVSARLTPAGRPLLETLRDHTPPQVADGDYRPLRGVGDNWMVIAAPDLPASRLDAYLGSLLVTEQSLGLWIDLPERLPRGLLAETHSEGCVDPARRLDRLAWVVNGVGPHERRLIAWLGTDGLHDGGAAHAAGIVREVLGEAAAPWLADALGVEASNVWWGRRLERWCGRLAQGSIPPIAELLADDACEKYSPHRIEPLRALLVRIAREQGLDPAALFLDPGRLVEVEDVWRARLAQLASEFVPRERRAVVLRGPYVHGRVGQTDPPLACEDDEATLDALAAFESVALKIHLAPPGPPSTNVALAAAPRIGLVEGDAAVIIWSHRARARGLGLVLCLERWAAASGVPSGDRVLPDGGPGWARFFDEGAAQMDHAGLVAVLAGADVLDLLVGQAEALVTRTVSGREPPETEAALAILAARAAGWQGWIEVVRQAYEGRLICAARRTSRLARFGAWDQLDMTGLRLFPEIGESPEYPTPPQRVFAAQLDRSLRLALRALPDDAPQELCLLPLELRTPTGRSLVGGAYDPRRLGQALRTGLESMPLRSGGPGLGGLFVSAGKLPTGGLEGPQWLVLRLALESP